MAYTKSLWSLRDEVAVQNDIAIATTTTYTAADESAQLALSVDKGDICVRTDIDRTYIALNDTNASMGDWQLLSDAVSSVNGYAGVVVLDTDDIAEGGTNQYYTDGRADARADLRIGNSSINALNDVDTFNTAPAIGQGLKWDGTNWIPGNDNDTTYTAGNGLSLSGTTFAIDSDLSDINDVSASAPTDGQVLKWDNANSVWAPADDTDTDTTYTAGTGLSLTGTVFALNSGIDGLSDVDTSTTAPTDGQVLKWDNANSVWVPANDIDTDTTVDFTDNDFTGDGSTTIFTVTNSLFTKAFVYINGVKQQAGAGNAYTISANANGTDTDVTFTTAPANNDWIQVTVFA